MGGLIDKAKAYRAIIEKTSQTLDDATALDVIDLFPAWVTGTAYEVDIRIRYGEKLYRCVQAHTSQDDWTPDKTPALWTEVSLDEWPEWVQPQGQHDSYMKGDKVSYKNKHWVCQNDYNVYAPDVWGWEEA